MSYQVVYTKQALSDWETINKQGNSNLLKRAKEFIALLEDNPFAMPPPLKQLTGVLKGLVARRLNLQHRFVYAVIQDAKTVKVVSMWTHYGD